MICSLRHTNSPFSWKTGLQLLWDALWQNPRSFRKDALSSARRLSPPPKIIQPHNIPVSGPALLVMNHYSRSGFGAWWIGLGISAQMPEEVHWMMTGGWTHTGLLNPFTRWLFPRFAQVYGFTITPPMPPNPNEVALRAKAVRAVLRIAKNTQAIIAIAPEGQDHPGGILGTPPPGVGRFLFQLNRYRERITPIGVYEDGPELCFNYGPPFKLLPPARMIPDARNRLMSHQVMEAIARLLPQGLRGEYA